MFGLLTFNPSLQMITQNSGVEKKCSHKTSAFSLYFFISYFSGWNDEEKHWMTEINVFIN